MSKGLSPALEELYDEGSPVWIEPSNDYRGITGLWITYFATEVDRTTVYMTEDGTVLR